MSFVATTEKCNPRNQVKDVGSACNKYVLHNEHCSPVKEYPLIPSSGANSRALFLQSSSDMLPIEIASVHTCPPVGRGSSSEGQLRQVSSMRSGLSSGHLQILTSGG